MTTNQGCPRCGSSEIIPGLQIDAGTGDSGTQTLRICLTKPDAPRKIFQVLKTVDASIRASVCCACGYTELHTENAPRLLEAYREGWR